MADGGDRDNVNGETLTEYLNRSQNLLKIGKRKEIMMYVAKLVKEKQYHGRLHPGNFIISHNENALVVRFENRMLAADDNSYTWRSPEQSVVPSGEGDRLGEIHVLGQILAYICLVFEGLALFEKLPYGVLQHLKKLDSRLSGLLQSVCYGGLLLDEDLADLIDQMTSFDPQQRPRDFYDKLKECLDNVADDSDTEAADDNNETDRLKVADEPPTNIAVVSKTPLKVALTLKHEWLMNHPREVFPGIGSTNKFTLCEQGSNVFQLYTLLEVNSRYSIEKMAEIELPADCKTNYYHHITPGGKVFLTSLKGDKYYTFEFNTDLDRQQEPRENQNLTISGPVSIMIGTVGDKYLIYVNEDYDYAFVYDHDFNEKGMIKLNAPKKRDEWFRACGFGEKVAIAVRMTQKLILYDIGTKKRQVLQLSYQPGWVNCSENFIIVPDIEHASLRLYSWDGAAVQTVTHRDLSISDSDQVFDVSGISAQNWLIVHSRQKDNYNKFTVYKCSFHSDNADVVEYSEDVL